MIVTSLKLKNFMNVSDASLEFKEGINVIGGSNGMGKSVIFAAQAFCLVGSKRGDSWKDFIKIGTDSMTVDLTLFKFKGDDPMYFHIEGSSNSSSMIREIRYKNEYVKNVECDPFLEKYFDLDMMENILFHLQDSSSIVNITPAKRRELLKKIFNSDFSKTVEEIKSDITSIKEAINNYSSKLEVLKSLKFDLKILDRVPKVDIEELKIDIMSLKKEILTLNELITTKKTILNQMLSSKSSLEQRLLSITSQKAKVISGLKEAEEKVANIDIASLEKDIEITKQEVEELSKNIIEITPVLEAYKEENKIKEQECSNLFSELIKKKTIVSSLEKQLKIFDTNSVCPTCGQSCDIKHKETLEKEILDLKEEIEEHYQVEYDEKLRDKENSIKFEKSSSESLMNSTNRKKEKESKIGALEREASTLVDMKQQREIWIAGERNRLKELEEEDENLKKSLYEIEKASVQEEVNKDLNIYTEAIHTNEQKVQEFEATIKNVETILLLNKEKDEFNKEIKDKEVETKQQIVDYLDLIEKKKIEIVELDYVKTIFDSELPNHIMNKACSFLQDGINNFMSTCKDNLQVQLVQNTKGIDFYYKARGEPDWLKAKMASGFESSLLTLAFKFTVALAYDSKFIIFDEPDKTADDVSSLRLIETISNVEGFNQIFITSHRKMALQYLQENNANIIMVNNGEYNNY
jgi:DNA repair exonuclease SbcCD ATPase subunit